MKKITWKEFERIELRVGTIVAVEDFPEARTPAYRIMADFGPATGIKQTSSQVTKLYSKEDLLGRQIIGLMNLPAKQVGPVRSEFLLTGFTPFDGSVILAVPERPVPNGSKMG